MAVDPRDLVLVADVKLQMGLTSAGQDDLIQRLITAASVAIGRWAGREFKLGTAPELRSILVRSRSGSTFRRRRVRIGDLSAPPTTVAVYDRAGSSAGVVTPAEVVSYPTPRTAFDPVTSIELWGGWAIAEDWRLDVTGTWGFPSIPPDVQQAVIVTVRAWLRRDASSGGASTGPARDVSPTEGPVYMLPMAAKQLLMAYRRYGLV